MILRVLHYNPLSANQLRLEEILRATRNFSIVGLVATQRRAQWGSRLDLQNRLVVQLWRLVGPEPRSVRNRLEYSSHCANPSPRNTYIRHRHHHHHSKVEHSRRASKEVFSICLSVAASKRGGYHKTVERLLEWLDGCLSEQEHRTTPVVLMEVNDGIGMELRAGRYRPVYCQCTAVAGARREHVAGKRLREIMEKHHMRATSAELGGATWLGDTGSSLIDYVWAPTALPLRCSGPLRKLAAELQLIDTRKLRDYVPLGLGRAARAR